MQYKILEANGIENENIDGGAFNNFTAGGKSGVIAEVLDECKLSSTGNTVIVSTGLLLIKGIRVKLEESVCLLLSGNPAVDTNYYIVAKVVLSADTSVLFDTYLTTKGTRTQENLYKYNNGTYELELGRFIHTTNGEIKDLQRTVEIITNQSSQGGTFESVIVDIQDFVDNQKVNEFIDLTRRFLDKKIIIVCKYNGAYFVPIIGIDSDNGTYIWRLEIVDDDGYVTKLSLTAQSPFTQLELKETRTLIVEANPTEEANGGNLEKLKVGDSTYSIPSGGGISQEELDKKVDKVTGTSTYNKVYVKTAAGVNTTLNNAHENKGSTIPLYASASSSAVGKADNGYTFAVAMPQQPFQPAPKIYVDENKGTQLYKHKFTSGYNLREENGYYFEVEFISTESEPYTQSGVLVGVYEGSSLIGAVLDTCFKGFGYTAKVTHYMLDTDSGLFADKEVASGFWNEEYEMNYDEPFCRNNIGESVLLADSVFINSTIGFYVDADNYELIAL